MKKSDFNSEQEAPKTHQVSSCGNAQAPDSEIQIKTSSIPPAANPSASNGRQPPLCRYFRRGFCRNGNACRFYHAGSQISDSSTANGTGSDDRVCRFYLQGRCRYGDSCRFLHIQPPAIKEDEDEDERELDLLQMAMLLGRAQNFEGLTGEALEEELEQRSRNCGFTDEEVFELACHGVKPWDEEAHAVLDVLNNGWDYYPSYSVDEDIDLRSLDLGSSDNGED